MRIEEATGNDIDELCGLLEMLFSQEVEFVPNRPLQAAGLAEIIDNPQSGKILVLRDENCLAGMINLLYTVSTALGGRVAILEDLIILPEYRGKGAGTRLVTAAINLARRTGCRRITLLTDGSNTNAQRFYSRHGFTPSEMVPMRLILGD